MRKKTEKGIPDENLLGGLLLFNLALKIMLMPVNVAEYTDGILQLTLFGVPNKLYPPFFTMTALMLKPILGNAEAAGRLVSAVASAFLVLPIYMTARALYEKRSAFFAALVYSVSPMALRWALHAMTDSLFAFLCFIAAICLWRALNETSEKYLIWGIVLSVVATLTRYQGILLIPPYLYVLWRLNLKEKTPTRRAAIAGVLWLLPAVWIVFFGFRHPEQFAERAGATVWQTFLNILLLAESFLAYSPYFLTLPVCFFLLAGLFYMDYGDERKARLLLLFVYLTAALLILQSAFSSFQERYLLPLLPFVALFAGWGIEAIRQRLGERKRIFKILLFVLIVNGLGFGLTCVFIQRESFADLKDAANFMKSLPADAVIYSNETYKDLGPVKMRYWSQRDILPMDDLKDIPAGSVVSITSAYGGMSSFMQIKRLMHEIYRAEILAQFDSSLVPLLPDIMQEPISHQNPLALTFRYSRQRFQTIVYQIPR